MLAIPGPTILLVIGQSLGAGRRAALPLVAGVALGDLTAMTLSLAGLGALLAASATLFTVLKFAGAAYLVWLGLRLWRAPVEAGALPPLSARRAFRDAYVVTALNPKSVAFFVAFVPLFLDPARPFPAQAAVLVASFVTLAAANAAIYALLAARLSGAVRRPGVRRAFNRGGGALLMGAGAATAAMRQGG
nr:LysE family translocator [Neoroseomonas alkaliterrae]